jgi:hypothetical protein
MRCLIPLVACLLACDVSATVSVSSSPNDAAVVEPTSPPVISLKPIEMTSVRASRRVLVVGDSEACRVGVWIKETVKAINDENREPLDDVHVVCKGGTVIQYWGDGGHLASALQEYPNPDDVLVFLGTNHYWVQQIPQASRVTNQLTLPMIQAVTGQLQSTNCIWVGNTAFRGHHWAVNGLIRDAVTPQCSYFDTEAANIPLEDEAHPGHAGAVKWLRLVWKTIPPKYEEADR